MQNVHKVVIATEMMHSGKSLVSGELRTYLTTCDDHQDPAQKVQRRPQYSGVL